MGAAFKYQVRIISSSVSAPSNYKDPVSPEVDRAWQDLFQGKLRGFSGGIHDNNSLGNHISISPEDMVKMNRTSVRLNGGSGDHIATPEVSGVASFKASRLTEYRRTINYTVSGTFSNLRTRKTTLSNHIVESQSVLTSITALTVFERQS